MIMCDIDHFKKYNDSLGHYAGDDCLKHVSAAIKRVCSRSIDQVFRYGGEEFAILVTDDAENIPKLAEAIRKEIYSLTLHHPHSPVDSITISAGYATLESNPGNSSKKLINMADKALYKAKNGGRNRCCGFDD